MASVAEGGNGRTALQKIKPYLAMVFMMFSFAVMYVTTLGTIKSGMNQSVMFVYRGMVAAVVIAPFAFMLERNGRPEMTKLIFFKILALAVLQPVLDQSFYYTGANLTSASFTSALENVNPAITFLLALLLRIEKLDIRSRHGKAKIVGAIVNVTGAVFMVLYRGPTVEFVWTKGRAQHHAHADEADHFGSTTRRIKGTVMILLACLSWCSFLILQANTLKSYPAKLTLTVCISSLGVVMNSIIAIIMERGSVQPWIIGWDMRLFVIIYSGVICTAGAYYILGMVMKKRGPVFASAFNPLSMIMTSILGSLILAERMAVGTIIGGVILATGLYCFLWGKSGDQLLRQKILAIEDLELPKSVTSHEGQCSIYIPAVKGQENKDENSISIASTSTKM